MSHDIDILVYSPCYSNREVPRVWRVLRATPKTLEEKPEPPKEAAYWPASICRISVYDEELVVWWIDEIAIGTFGWALERAWSESGDNRPITHRLADELADEDIPF